MSNHICNCQSDEQTIDDALNNIYKTAQDGKLVCADTLLATAYFEYLASNIREGQNSQVDAARTGMIAIVAMQRIAQKTIQEFILKYPYIYGQIEVIAKEYEDDKSGK